MFERYNAENGRVFNDGRSKAHRPLTNSKHFMNGTQQGDFWHVPCQCPPEDEFINPFVPLINPVTLYVPVWLRILRKTNEFCFRIWNGAIGQYVELFSIPSSAEPYLLINNNSEFSITFDSVSSGSTPFASYQISNGYQDNVLKTSIISNSVWEAKINSSVNMSGSSTSPFALITGAINVVEIADENGLTYKYESGIQRGSDISNPGIFESDSEKSTIIFDRDTGENISGSFQDLRVRQLEGNANILLNIRHGGRLLGGNTNLSMTSTNSLQVDFSIVETSQQFHCWSNTDDSGNIHYIISWEFSPIDVSRLFSIYENNPTETQFDISNILPNSEYQEPLANTELEPPESNKLYEWKNVKWIIYNPYSNTVISEQTFMKGDSLSEIPDYISERILPVNIGPHFDNIELIVPSNQNSLFRDEVTFGLVNSHGGFVSPSYSSSLSPSKNVSWYSDNEITPFDITILSESYQIVNDWSFNNSSGISKSPIESQVIYNVILPPNSNGSIDSIGSENNGAFNLVWNKFIL